MTRDFVANDDELEVVVEAFLFSSILQRGEGLDDAHHILVRADASGVEQERAVHLVALGDELALGVAGVSQAEAVVDGVVDDLDFLPARH